MLTNLKALVVVLAISWMVFALSKPTMLRFVEPEAFRRRRNLWFILTVVGFTSPSIWLYALIAMPLMYRAAKKDANPLALYVLLAWVIPRTNVQIPTVLIGQLLEINQSRMMAVAILLPVLFRTTPVPGMSPSRKLTVMDWTLVGLGALQLALVLPYDSPTNSLRRGVVFFLDTFLMFYAFARVAPVPKILREVFANLVLAIALMSAIGLFESVRGWLLYIGIGPVWGAIEPFTAYIMRGSLLRAQAASGHSLALGYLTALGFGLWLYLSDQEPRRVAKYSIFLLLLAGCMVSGSRGGWLTAMLLFLAYALLRPKALQFMLKAVPVLIVGTLIAYNSPLKESVIDKLPIIGTADQDTVEYRQQIAEVSWRLIKQNPIWGDPFALRNMDELRQGQGIVDIMNGYANVAIFSGGVGFALFISIFVIALWRCLATMIRLKPISPDLALMGADLIACLLATLFFIGTAAVDSPTYWITGLMVSYCGLALGGKLAPFRADAAAPTPVSGAGYGKPMTGGRR